MTSRHSRHRRDDSPTFDSDSETYVENSDDSRSPSPAGLREAYRERRQRYTRDSLGKAVLVVGLVVAACVVQHLRARRAGERRYHEDQRREHEIRRQERRRRRHEREAWERQRALEDWEERRARPRIEGAPLERDGRKLIEAPPARYDSNTHRQYGERDGYDDRRSRSEGYPTCIIHFTSMNTSKHTASSGIEASLAEMDPPALPGAYVRKPTIERDDSCESRYESMYVDPVWRLDTIRYRLSLDIARSDVNQRANSNSSPTLRFSSCSLSDGSDTLTVSTSSDGRSQAAPELFSWEGVDELFPTRFQINTSTALGSHTAHHPSGSSPSYLSRGPSLLRKRSMTDLNAQYIRRNSDGSYTARLMTVNATAPARIARRLPCHLRSDDVTPPLSPRLRSLSTSGLRRGPQLHRLGGYVPVDQLETLSLRPRVQATSDTVSKMKATLRKVFTRQQKAKDEDEKPLLIGLPYEARHVEGYGTTFESIMASQA